MLHTIKVRIPTVGERANGVEKKLERETASENVLPGRTKQTNIMYKTLIMKKYVRYSIQDVAVNNKSKKSRCLR